MSILGTLMAENSALKERIGKLERELIVAYGRAAEDRKQFVPISAICELVSQKTGIPVSCLRADIRDKPVFTSRHIVMYLAAIYTKCSLMRIGRYLNKDHTAVIHGRERIKQRIKQEPAIKALVEELTVSVQNSLLARDEGNAPSSSVLETAALLLS